MTEFRCWSCKKLLAKYAECKELQVKCSRCSSLNVLNQTLNDEKLPWKYATAVEADILHNVRVKRRGEFLSKEIYPDQYHLISMDMLDPSLAYVEMSGIVPYVPSQLFAYDEIDLDSYDSTSIKISDIKEPSIAK